ncbi:hypothetical protein O6H91_06G126900 [Diphasiastrum complanatum]|uniref:Uncharacterized protein n=2 Tax=Diphasiastrum complanatum TaxID=34168 RepID=A0ACC2DIP0_DIPCM|nr:hypothetical protein O6H91_06G126900 [Diphasiastrum complanatum]
MELPDHTPSTKERSSDFKSQVQAGVLKTAYTVARSNRSTSFRQSSPKVEDVVRGRIATPQLSCNESLALGYCSFCQVIKTSSESREGSHTVLPTGICINANIQERSMCSHDSVLNKPPEFTSRLIFQETYKFISKHAEKPPEKNVDAANVDNPQTLLMSHRNAMLSAFTAFQRIKSFEASSRTRTNLEKEKERLLRALVGLEIPSEANSWESHIPRENFKAYGCSDEAHDDIDLLMSSSDEEEGQFNTERFTREVNEYAHPISPSTYSSANKFFPDNNYRRTMVTPEIGHDFVVADSRKLLSYKSPEIYAKAEADPALHCIESLEKVRQRPCPDTTHKSASTSGFHFASTVSGSARKARRNHLRRTFDSLRRIIPRGNTQNDRALVLDEAIDYLTSLQEKVQELESSRIAQSQRSIVMAAQYGKLKHE